MDERIGERHMSACRCKNDVPEGLRLFAHRNHFGPAKPGGKTLSAPSEESVMFRICCDFLFIIAVSCPQICRADEPASNEPASVAKEICVVRDPRILEASGLAISRTVNDAVWMHNDSGDVPRLFLVGLDGVSIGIVNVKGVTAFDWEDVCSFEMNGESWLLVGDIGDNARKRSVTSPTCQLLLLKEPKLKPGESTVKPTEVSIEVFRTISFQFPDEPYDCESLAVDTATNTILLVTKSAPTTCAMYSLPLNLTQGEEIAKAQRVTSISATFATAMDLSPDGRRLAIVNMFGGVMLTRSDPKKDSWADASINALTTLKLPNRKQGESVCFTADGDSLLLNSEGAMQPLWQIDLAPGK